MAVTNVYGNGVNSTAGENTIIHFYDKAGVKAANRVNAYGQFASRKAMPTKMGKTFKISKFLHMYDRELGDTDFAAKGYLTSRSAASVSAALQAATLAEGAGAVNKRSLKKITMETSLARYGEMIDYTDEVELFSEDTMQVRYREELGALANSRWEDLLQLDMLATPTVMYSGTATSMATIGDGVAADGSTDDVFKVSYDLIRRATRKLQRNRAKKNTSIVTGDVKIGTTPINAAYYAIIGPEVKADLETLTRGVGYEREFSFEPVHKYASAASLAEGEVGSMHEVRFVEAEGAVVYEGLGADVPAGYTGSLANNGTKFNVYPILFPTQDAFATVGLKGQGKIKFNSRSPEFITNENPFGTQGFFSYNFFYAGIILEEEKILKVLVAAGQ
jgi:N4-gp56 family major capsid protein